MKVLIDVEVLKRLEWITDEFTGVTGGRCRICNGYKKDRNLHLGEFAGHASGCALDIAIKNADEPVAKEDATVGNAITSEPYYYG